MNSQAPILMSAEMAWPARPSASRGLPSPAQSHGFRSSPVLGSSPQTPTSPSFSSGGAFPSAPSSAYDPVENGALSRKSSLGGAIRHDGGRRFHRKSQLDRSDRSELDKSPTPPPFQRTYSGTPLQPDKVARIAQTLGVNISVPEPPHTSPQYRIGPASRSLASSYGPPSPSTDLALSARSSSSLGSSRVAQASSSTKYFISVVPPTSLAPKSASTAQFRRGELLPLHPTLAAQVQAIAREYGLPSTVGIVLFLVYEGAEAPSRGRSEPGPRLGKETWKMLWQELFGVSSTVDGDERGPSRLPNRSQPPALLPSLFSSRRELSEESDGGPRSLSDSPTRQPHTPTSASSPSASRFDPVASSASPSFSGPRTPIASSSLLTRDPATLSPSYFKLTAGRRPSATSTGSSRHRRTETASTNPSSSSSVMTNFPSTLSSSTTPTSRPFSPNVTASDPSASPSASHYLSPSVASSQAGTSFAPPPLRIVGTVEFDIDQSRGGEWYGTWLKSGRRGVERVGIVPEEERRPVEHVAPVAARETDDSSSEYGEEEDAISDAGSGYVPLSEDDGEDATTRETSEDIGPQDEHELDPALGADPLGDVFPSDEQEWDDIRAARTEGAEDEDDQKGLGIRSSRGGRESLILSGAELSRGLDDDIQDNEFDSADLDRKEIEELLARHPPAPGYGDSPSGETPPDTPADRTSTPGGRSTRRNTALSNPLNLTLASPITLADSPNQSSLPVLTTSPTSSEMHAQGVRGIPRHMDDSLLSPTSETSGGGLAYLRGNSMDDVSTASRSSLDGGMSAALYGAFGVGEHGEMLGEEGDRSSAFLMHESLNDLEKALASLSPRDLRIPTRDRPYASSPNSDTSYASAANLPARPRTPPNQRLLPAGAQEDSPSSVPSPQFRGPKLDREERDAAALSIAGSFLSAANDEGRPRADVPVTPHSGKSTFTEMMASNQRQDVPPLPAWPAVPVTPGSPLLNQITLPVRKESPLTSPTSATSSQFPDVSGFPFVPASPPRKISVESMQRMEYERPRIRQSEDRPIRPSEERPQPKPEEEPWQPHKLERLEVMEPAATPADATVGSPGAAPRARSNSISRAIKSMKWGGSRSGSTSGPSVPEQANLSPASPSPNQNLMPAPSPPLPAIPFDASLQRKASYDGRLHPSFSGSNSMNGRSVSGSPSNLAFPPTSASLSSPRSVSDSASSGYNQFGKYTTTLQADQPTSIMQQQNMPGSPTPPSPKNSTKSKGRFKAPFTAGSIFGKKKPAPQSEISSPDPNTSGAFPAPGTTLLSQGDDSPHSSSNSPQRPTYIPHSISNLSSSNLSHSNSTSNVVSHYSPPASPSHAAQSAQSPRRELRRKPVPNVGAPAARERTSSQYSAHSRASSYADSRDGHGGGSAAGEKVVPDLPDQPLPLRSTSLKAGAAKKAAYEAEDEEGSLA